MKSRRLLLSTALCILLLTSFHSYSQVQTARPISISGTCGGYYEYLPQGYSSNTWQSYPLIVAVHGIGELGNGTSDLPNLLNCWTSIPRLIANGGFPSSFNVGGQNFSFIVICPQFKSWPSGADVNAVVDYAVQNYRVDQSRIYVTGLSMGGGSVWDFAGNYPTKAAAVVPVCGAASSDPTRASAIANAKLAVWATHNQDDPTVSVSNTTGWVNLINQYGGNIISTIFPVSGHDAWTKTYDPNFTQNGVNIYQWMLQHQKGNSSTTPPPTTTTNQSPTANAGNSQTITLPQSSVTLSGSGTDPDGTINFYQWSQTSGPSQASFSSLYSANPVVSGLVQGSYVFTLKVTDNGGATATSSVTITVNAAATGSTTSNLTSTISGSTRIEAENYANMSGVVKEGTSDAGGGQDVGYIDYGDWMDYNVNVSSAGSYAMNLRVASPTGGQLQIRNSAGTVLATVSIPATGGWQSWQTVTTNISLSAGTQTIRVYSTSNGWNFNWLEIAGAGTISAASVSKAEVVSSTSSVATTAISIYPNPIVNSFELQINNDLTGQVSVQVYDVSGTLQKQFSLAKPDAGTSQYYLSIGTLSSGTYIIKVTMNSWTQSKQIIKQ
jgi:dienelactone hydrolase